MYKKEAYDKVGQITKPDHKDRISRVQQSCVTSTETIVNGKNNTKKKTGLLFNKKEGYSVWTSRQLKYEMPFLY